VRIDHVADFEAKGCSFSAGGKALAFDRPDWLPGELAALKDAKG
jgi:hypothetical protein